MHRAPSVLVVVLAASLSAQQARRAPGEIGREKALLLGTAGSMLPESGRLGPFTDLDADGDVDLLAGARVHLNDGFGVFRATRPVDVADEPRHAFFLADADGELDLLTREHLYLGDGALGFVDASARLPRGFVADAAVTADLDGDLDLDLVALELVAWGIVRVALNDGHGLFTDRSAMLPAPPASARRLAAGDLDGDLDLDLVIGGSSGGAVWLNDGSARFSAAAGALPSLALATTALALADVEGDADLDLVLAGAAPDAYSRAVLLRNDGSGVFGASVLFDPWQRTEAILVFDGEGDGDPDLAFVCSTSPYGSDPYTISTYATCFAQVNDGTGAFDASFPLPGFRGSYRSGFAGDVDGDGDADLVFEDDTFPHRLFLNDGLGSFAATRPATVAGASVEDMSSRIVALGDLDGDGLPDAFTAQAILRNRPPGVFTPLATPLPPLDTACWWDPFFLPVAGGVSLGDVDGDGDLDAYVLGRGMGDCNGPYYQSNRLWVNDGSARFTDETLARLPLGGEEVMGNPTMVALLELDGDGDLDAACARSEDYDGSGYSSCYVNDGSGVFTRRGDLGSRSYTGAFGDLDGDGDADYLEGSYYYYVKNGVHLNDGSAHFVHSLDALPDHERPLDANASALGDIDGDGDLDAYVSVSAGARSSFVYVNDGTGRFADEPERLPRSVPGYRHVIAFADADLDADLDLVTATGLFVNDGTGFFSDTPDRTEAYAFDTRMALGDVDLDGDPDLVLVDEVQTTVAVSFARHVESLGPARLGKRHTLLVHGPPSTPYTLLESLGHARIPLGSPGWLLVDPNQLVSTTTGFLGAQGEAPLRRSIPPDPALLGLRSYWQAFVGTPPHSTNLLVSEVGAL